MDEEKWKHSGLAQEIGFGSAQLQTLQWLVKKGAATTLCTCIKETSVIDMTWLLLSISDRPIILIGPGGLLLVVPPPILLSQFQFLWVLWGWKKKGNNQTWMWKIFYFCRVTYWEHCWRCSKSVTSIIWPDCCSVFLIGPSYWLVQVVCY